MLLHSRQSLYFNLIGPVREINILTWLRGFRNKLLFLVFFLYTRLLWEVRDKKHFVLKGFVPCWKFDNRTSPIDIVLSSTVICIYLYLSSYLIFIYLVLNRFIAHFCNAQVIIYSGNLAIQM